MHKVTKLLLHIGWTDINCNFRDRLSPKKEKGVNQGCSSTNWCWRRLQQVFLFHFIYFILTAVFRDTGNKVRLRRYSRGIFAIVRAGGHIDTFAPLKGRDGHNRKLHTNFK